jgi:hypothetical protein
MALYVRLLGTDPVNNRKIPIHQFQAIVACRQRNQMTLQQARDAVTALSGSALTAGEETELTALIATVPGGSTTANQAARALRLHEIDQIMLLADSLIPPFNTEAGLKAGLGV